MKNKRNVRKLQCFIAFLIIIIFTAFYEYFKFNEEGKAICIALECPKVFIGSYLKDFIISNI